MSASRLGRRSAMLLALGAAGATGGCDVLNFNWLTDDAPKPLPKGNAEPVIATPRGLVEDAVSRVVVPDAVRNPAWAQYGGGPTHAGGNLAGGLDRRWRVEIGKPGGYRAKLTAQPLIVEDRVFTMDADGAIDAFELKTGRRLWHTVTKPKKNRTTNVGGGIGVADGVLYATTGRNEALALNPEDGTIRWRAPLAAPARSAPTIVDGRLFVGLANDQLVGLATADGHQLWSFQSTVAPTAVLGQGAPAVSGGIVVMGFGSGELTAVRADTGAQLWSDNLGAVRGEAGLASFSSVQAGVVIADGLVHAIGLGGLLAANDLRSGRRVWERDVPGSFMPWVAGDVIYIVSTDQQLAAIQRSTGLVHWVTQLPQFLNVKRSRGLIRWTGPVMVGGKLVLVSDENRMLIADPLNGEVVTTRLPIPDESSVSPVVAQGVMLVLTTDAALSAFS